MAFSVHGKTAIVTGAGSGIFTCSIQLSLVLLISSPTGINLAFARLLLSRGCNVLFVDLALRPEAEETIQKYKTTRVGTLGRAAFQRTDVSKWTEVEKMFQVAEREFGGSGADIVVPGAGVYESVCGVIFYTGETCQISWWAVRTNGPTAQIGLLASSGKLKLERPSRWKRL
jgi:3-hydroxybutyrate dehydrogenase